MIPATIRGRRHQEREGEDAGYALMLVLLTMITVVTALTAVLAIILSQAHITAITRARAQALAAAEAGQNATLKALRDTSNKTVDSVRFGAPSLLPCLDARNPLTGTTGSSSGVYSVRVRYYSSNPAGQSEAWRDSHTMRCQQGKGLTEAPLFAVISSTGKSTSAAPAVAAAGTRSVEVIYTFAVTDKPPLGGQIHFKVGETSLCLTNAKHPQTNGGLVMRPCQVNNPAQNFNYRRDSTIVLSSTLASDGNGGQCLTNDTTAQRVIFTACGPVKWDLNAPTMIEQRYVYRGSGQFFALTPDGKNVSSWCVQAQQVAEAPVILTSCLFEYGRPAQRFEPDAAVGAGAAGAQTQQLVNHEQYSRCLDVTDENVYQTYLILWGCKQGPTGDVTWNQRWTWDALSGQLQTNPGVPYCLTTGVGEGPRVLVRPCSTSAVNQRWTVNGASSNRATAYQITENQTGQCLSVAEPGVEKAPYIIIEPCDGSAKQKWNAPPAFANGSVSDYRELHRE